jgi:hypothetical protein
VSTVPSAIRERYAAGEREIRVSRTVFADYCDGLMAMYRRTANVRNDKDTWVAYKAARVIRDDRL